MSTVSMQERSVGWTGAPDPRARLLAGLPVIEQRVRLAGIMTPVIEGGGGAPLLLLHGPGESAVKWLRVLPELVKTHHVIAPDLPDHGASWAGGERLDVHRVLAWLGELIEHCCASPPVLVGHVIGGAIAARFAIDHGERINRLVLVDSLGLAPFRPSPRFALGMIGFLARPGEHTYERFMRQCSYDLDALRAEMGERWEPFVAYNLMGARSPRSRTVGFLMRAFGLRRIPPEDLARIAVPTALIWGRHDRASRLRVAEQASARYGWPLYVVDHCADDPARDRPDAFLEALHQTIGTTALAEARS
jgi:pimeloyl-ACP methyl ester carboxylesterase